MTTRRAYSAGHFELQLDGRPSTAYVKSVDGGYLRAGVIDEPIGAHVHRIKHVATVEVDPITIELGMAGAGDVLRWIRASWRREIARRNGQISHADFDLATTFEHDFTDALILETAFPALDGAAKEPAYLKCKLQPERVGLRTVVREHRVRGSERADQKLWTPAAFRLSLDGVAGIGHVNRIEAFAIKQNVKKLHVGEQRLPQIEPTRIEFPALTCSLALAHAGGVLAWYERYVVAGEADPAAQTTGALELLSPDRATTLLRIDLYDVGIQHLHVATAAANAAAIKRVQFELYVGRMDLVAA